jgi:hypothetical protein
MWIFPNDPPGDRLFIIRDNENTTVYSKTIGKRERGGGYC